MCVFFIIIFLYFFLADLIKIHYEMIFSKIVARIENLTTPTPTKSTMADILVKSDFDGESQIPRYMIQDPMK